MIYEDYNRPGELIPNLSLDSVKELYPRLEIAVTSADVEEANELFKAALIDSCFDVREDILFETYKRCVIDRLKPREARRVIEWLWNAYSGSHLQNPNMYWATLIQYFSSDFFSWPDIGQTEAERRRSTPFAICS